MLTLMCTDCGLINGDLLFALLQLYDCSVFADREHTPTRSCGAGRLETAAVKLVRQAHNPSTRQKTRQY